MKRKDIQQLHTKTVAELRQAAKQLRDELFTHSIEHSQRKLKDTRSLFNKKKDMAKVLTVLKEKELEHASD